MSGKQTVIAGIPLPSDAPLFLASALFSAEHRNRPSNDAN
jgi:hypothetical protein